ncbi:MAG: flavocytochrome c [Syntrophales bacterium]|jgi:fumarate reductase flavoprotein subunit|nr:flavocytochrome c [Syntrophales bacterium]
MARNPSEWKEKQRPEQPGYSRRGVLQGAMGAGLLTAMGSLLPASDSCAAIPMRNETVRWDETWDVVVVGSGFAGLAAAAEAADRGMKVVILEKMPAYGGNAIISHGEYAAWDDMYHLRQKLGLGEDSAARHAKDIIRGGNYYGHPDLAGLVAGQAPAALKWLLEEGYAKIRETVTMAPGHVAPRIHAAIGGSGRVFVTALKKMTEQNGAVLRMNEKVTRIWRSSFSSPVTGVEVERGNKPINIAIRRALILASGGFSRDLAMRQAYNPAIGKEYNSTNHAGATGEIIHCARVIGADVTQMSFIQVYPFADPMTGRFDVPSVFALRGPAAGMIYVDPAGRRFVNELAGADTCSRAQIRTAGDNKMTYALFNQAMISRMGTNDEVEKGLEAGRFVRGESLAELAKYLQMSPVILEETVSNHNGYLRSGRDPEWEKSPLEQMIPLAREPYYMLPQWPAVHHTLGGLRINIRAQVIDVWGKPIPRLYAAGEVTGGIHGEKRLAGNSIPECLVFGRIAGTSAAELKRLA